MGTSPFSKTRFAVTDLGDRVHVPPEVVFRSPVVERSYRMSEGYASFKTNQGTIVSTKKFKSHAEVARWVAAEISAAGIQANDIRGKPSWPVGKDGK
jgi:hypothetical protein